MTDHYPAAQQAEGKLRISIRRLVGKYPFHVGVLGRFKVVARPSVGTVAVTVAGDDVLLLHNPAFVLDTPADQLGGVLLQLVHHVVLGHVLADPADFPDGWARTVAEELTANEFVREPLPEGAITLDQFPGLPPLESTRRRYDRLQKRKRRPQLGPPLADRAPADDQAGAGQDALPGGVSPPSGSLQTADDQAGAGQDALPGGVSPPSGSPQTTDDQASAGQDALPGGVSPPSGSLQTVDDHTVWEEARRDPERAQAAVRDVLRQAAVEAGLDNLPPKLRQIVEALGVGKAPGRARQDLRQEGSSRLDWRRLLRRYVGQVLEVRPVYNRPPRRFPELVGIVPGQRRQATRPKIMAVLDTSGSITTELLVLINAELARLARHFTVKVVECDAAIQRVYNYQPVREVHGRGRTDLRPPLEQKFLRKHRPDLVIYFSDGYGPAPERPPGLPVIWCLTPQGKQPARWGRVVRMVSAERKVSHLHS